MDSRCSRVVIRVCACVRGLVGVTQCGGDWSHDAEKGGILSGCACSDKFSTFFTRVAIRCTGAPATLSASIVRSRHSGKIITTTMNT